MSADKATEVLRMIRSDMQQALRQGKTGGQKTNGGNGPLAMAVQLPSAVRAFEMYVRMIDEAIGSEDYR